MSSLLEQAESRKRKITELKLGKNINNDNLKSNSKNSNNSNQILSGRNFDIENEAPKSGFESKPESNTETVEEVVGKIEKNANEKAKEKEENSTLEIDIANLRTKKINWDLKRDVEKDLNILEQRTNNAIYKILKDRLSNVREKEDS